MEAVNAKSDPLEEVEAVLDVRVRPALAAHHGDVTVRSIDDGVVHLEWMGACVGCPLRLSTTAALIAPALLSIPGIRTVESGMRTSEFVTKRLLALAPSPQPRAPEVR